MRVYPVPPGAGYWGVEGSFDLDKRGLQPRRLHELNLLLRRVEGTPAHGRLLRLGAVRTVVALHPHPFADLAPAATFTSLFGETIRTFRVPGARPRVYAVGRARVADEAAAIPTLIDPSLDPAREVVLSGPGAATAAATRGPDGGRVRVVELFADRARFEVDLDGPGFVVSVDAWAPGWRAFVDGRPADVLRANAVFRAVTVPAGRHVVEMLYRPRTALVGLTLSGMAVAAVATVGGVLFIRRRRARAR
jgi:hypothetical protein